MRWYLNRNGETSGPYPESVIQGWVASGQVGDDATVREEFSSEWVPVRQSRIFTRRSFQVSLLIFAMGTVALFVGLFAFAYEPDKPRPPYSPPSEEATRGLCPDEPRFPSPGLWVCSKEGDTDKPVMLNSASGMQRGQIRPPMKVVLLADSDSGPSSVRRYPGHVEQKICPLEGPHAGEIRYVQDIHILEHPCEE